MFRDLEEKYYRGLCRNQPWDPRKFCRWPEVLTFTQATLYAPLLLIFILYFPTIVYIFYVCKKFYGPKNLLGKIMDDPVYFMFPLLTCISFYKHEEKDSEEVHEVQVPEGMNESQDDITGGEEPGGPIDMSENFEIDEDLENSCSIANIESSSSAEDVTIAESPLTESALAEEQFSDPHEEEQDIPPTIEQDYDDMGKQFSLHQSNTLYFLFCLSFAIIIGGDFTMQRARWSKVSLIFLVTHSVTAKYLFIFLLNLYLWVDFTRGSQSKSIITLCNGIGDLL